MFSIMRPLINLCLFLRNSVRQLGSKALEQVRDPITGKLTFISPQGIKTASKIIFFCLFALVLIYVLSK